VDLKSASISFLKNFGIVILLFLPDTTYGVDWNMTNKYLQAFNDRLALRYQQDTTTTTYSAWIRQNTTLHKVPFSFKNYAFQEAIADDEHPDLSCIKCSQVGLTEVQIRKWLAFLRRTDGLNGIFTLPNEKMYRKISKGRILPVLNTDGVFTLEGEEKSVRSMDMVQIGASFGYVSGCTEADATSTSADIVFHDELDLSPMNMISLFQSRLQNSTLKINQKFSTPTFTDYGIDAEFSASDQREFLCKCVVCNHWQIPDFTREFVFIPNLPDDVIELTNIDTRTAADIDFTNAYVGCEKCHAQLDLGNGEMREWVARYPDRTLKRGYRVRPFSNDRISIAYIIKQLLEYQNKGYVRGFHNTVLGRPYVDSDSRLSEADIKACMTTQRDLPDIGADVPIGIGIDVGNTCHIVLGKMQSDESMDYLHFESVNVSELAMRVKQLDNTYNIVTGGIDRHPYTPQADEVRDLTDRRVMPIEYRGVTPLNIVEDEFEQDSHIQVNRTKVIDTVAKGIRRKVDTISGYGMYKNQIIVHLQDMVRDEQPDKPAVWVKLKGNDHFFHAMAMLKAGYQLRQVRDDVAPGELRSTILMAGVDVKASVPRHKLFQNGKLEERRTFE
jgi:hypothetical protein